MGRDRAGKVRLLVMTRPSGNQRKEFSSGAGPSSGLVRALTYNPSIELPDCGLHANWGFFFSQGSLGQKLCKETVSSPAQGWWRAERGARRFLLSGLSMEGPFIDSFIHPTIFTGCLL